MGLNPLTIEDLKFREGKEPEIHLYYWASRGVTFRLSIATREGIEDHSYSTGSARARQSDNFRIANFPVSLIVRNITSPLRRGELYVTVHLELGGYPKHGLCEGYVYDGHNLSWPPGVFEGMTDGPGLLRSVTGTDPAAGAEITETVPTNARWRLAGMRIILTTNSTVATRRVILLIDDGTNELHRIPSQATQIESKIFRYSFSPVGFDAAARDASILCALPHPLLLFQGWRALTTTLNLQAGDNYGAPQMLIEEWIEE